MYPKTRKALAAFASLFWALALGVLVYSAEEGAPQAPLFGFFAIAGAMFSLGWLIVFVHDRDITRSETAPAIPEPADGDGEMTVAFTKLSRRIPSPRIYMADPCPPELSTYPTVEMVPVAKVARVVASLYDAAHGHGFGDGFGAATGAVLSVNDPPTNGHDLSESHEG